jgi:uracil-DNA glycosylase
MNSQTIDTLTRKPAEDYRIFKLRIGTAHKAGIVWGSGHPNARVMLLGERPQPEEYAPFTKGHGTYLRIVNGMVGAPDPLLFYNYLNKSTVRDPSFESEVSWSAVLKEEVNTYLHCRSVVLLGRQVATPILNVYVGSAVRDLDKIRRTIWHSDKFPGVHFFVTYSPDDAHHQDESGDMTVSHTMANDLRAVYEVNQAYFDQKRKF